MLEEVRKFLRADEWQGIAVILEFIVLIGGSLWAAVKYRLIASIKEYRLIVGIVMSYFIGGYLILNSKESFWILWWFILMISVYIINQLLSYPELFVKGFQDDFRNGLQVQNWEHYGDWRVMQEPDGKGNFLQVSNSDAGGINTKCKTWTNYRFSFDTKIIKHNSSWIIRATDVFSYVMLQCESDKLRVHYRVQGNWVVVYVDDFPFNIALKKWFHVEIEVKDIRLIAKITYRNEVYTAIDNNLLEPRVIPIIPVTDDSNNVKIKWACSYPNGSVGFRQFGDETAYFKNVKVFKI